jgi:hypothetical protein
MYAVKQSCGNPIWITAQNLLERRLVLRRPIVHIGMRQAVSTVYIRSVYPGIGASLMVPFYIFRGSSVTAPTAVQLQYTLIVLIHSLYNRSLYISSLISVLRSQNYLFQLLPRLRLTKSFSSGASAGSDYRL